MSNLDLGIIGNSTFSALVDKMGRIVWSCLPRFDGDPVFCSLLMGEREQATRGFFDVLLADFSHSTQQYLHNTAVLVTTLYDHHGNAVEITDFTPRFKDRGRIFRPVSIIRQLRPVAGHPRITVRLRPTFGYGAEDGQCSRGSNHLRYAGSSLALRCTTNLPVAYLADEVPFLLEEEATLIFGVDESFPLDLVLAGHEYFERTREYWQDWARFLAIPFEWQKAVIRSAITLKLCSLEETGAIIAAATTSIPEAAGSERNWDYRYCWLRDAYFVVQALNRLGATKTMEDHIRYITNIVAGWEGEHLQPVYGVALGKALIEEVVEHLPGYRGMGPVRRGNQAYEHIQNDIYGSVILAATQTFFDQRLRRPGDVDLFERLEAVGYRCVELYDKPDAGLWELRTMARVHTYSAVMCWAGADRLARIADQLGLYERAAYWRKHADQMHRRIIDEAFDRERNTFVESFGGQEVDASLLLMFELGFLPPEDPRFVGTVEAVERALRRGDHMFRYTQQDDFGYPETAFNICTFWLIDSLAAIGRHDEARRLFEKMLDSCNHLGLLSEDIDPSTGELWGNFPQTYSMVGLINSALRLSKKWSDAF
ncbi:MAG: glycoside hydrolase family 15 protein [Granulosicoccaceae bacterium]|jgi:pentatricopeptide repeat protein